MLTNNQSQYECEWCEDSGYVPADEFDPDSGQYMHGVGQQRCICNPRDVDPDDL